MFIVVREINNWIVTGYLPISRRGLHWFSLVKELISRNLEAETTYDVTILLGRMFFLDLPFCMVLVSVLP